MTQDITNSVTCTSNLTIDPTCNSFQPYTVALHALSMGFSRQEDWSGLPFPTPGDLPDPGIEPASPVSPALQALLEK